jgi:hypothetical protein
VHIEKRLECPVCEKRFLYPAHLRDHARSHDKAKPYECEVCRCRFSTRTHAYAHVRIMHAALGTVVEVKGEGGVGLPKHRRPGSRCKKVRDKWPDAVPCNLCSRLLRNEKSLRAHLRRCPKAGNIKQG